MMIGKFQENKYDVLIREKKHVQVQLLQFVNVGKDNVCKTNEKTINKLEIRIGFNK